MLKITKKALKATQKSVNLGINLRILSQTSFNSGKADKRERERERANCACKVTQKYDNASNHANRTHIKAKAHQKHFVKVILPSIKGIKGKHHTH